MSLRRVALVYDDLVRPDTTGGYCLRALRSLADVSHFGPARAGDIPAQFDLLLRVDDGLEYEVVAGGALSAFWVIDTHLDFARALRRARGFDVVSAAQKEGAARLAAEGIEGCEWLPLACDPEVHRRLEVEKEYDVAFVGHVFPGPRQELLKEVRRRFPRCFIGQAPHTEMAGIYSRARIVINCSLANDLNMRVFEALSCGALLVTNRLRDNGQDELFQDRVHVVEYGDLDEAVQLIAYYLNHEDERRAIAEAGHQEVVAHHTYRHRMQRVLEQMEALAASGRPSRPRSQPREASASRGGRDHQYFHWGRPDLRELVPRSASRILDVGCAAGVVGESLKRRQSCEVVGIELDPEAAGEAETRLDAVVRGDVEALDLTPLGQFDAVVCGDVLEHLRDPGAVLRKLREVLSPEGLLIASFPNARHMDVVLGLVEGNWTYEPAGLLDRDHLRFFTRRSAEQLLEDCGFEVAAVRAVPGQGYGEWEQAGRPGELRAGRLGISGLGGEEAGEFFVGQWLMTAGPAPRTDWGLTSIVVVTWDQLAYTRLCVESIRKHTQLPYELIVVDNGSRDGTREWLEGQPGLRLITNPENLGFARAANQGLREARGENLLLLNNDTVVTPGWLRRLLEDLHSAPEVGMVGPLTNFSSGEQQIPVPYQSLAEVDGFAWDLGRRHRGEATPTDRLVGFCLLIKREVTERIGLLDEQFEVGCFEDDDICRRAVQAGYRLLICRDAFIHHFGGRTFVGHQLPMGQIMEENRRRFLEKWQLGTQAAAPAPASPPAALPGQTAVAAERPPAWPAWRIRRCPAGGLALERRDPTISLCMIVRDEERHLADCLRSIRPFVDEMVVVDTGSRDRTPEIARSLEAKVVEAGWQDSFSAARNLSLEQATGDWIFWLDADDVIPEESGRALRRCAEAADEKVLGFLAQVHCPAGPGEHGETVVDHVKLFRNRSDLRFELRIHEQVLPSIRRAGGEIARAPIQVTHAHYDHSPAGQQRKRERDRRLLELDLEENPDHPFVHFNVGMTAAHEGEHERAIKHLRRSIDLSEPTDSQVRKAYALVASCCRALGKAGEALAACAEGRRVYPDDPELLFNEALAHQMAGDLGRAESVLRELLALPGRGDYIASVDAGILSYKARHNLGAVYEQMGRLDEAEACWRQVVAEQPDFLPSWLALGEVLSQQGRSGALEGLAAEAAAAAGEPTGELLRGRAALRRGDLVEAQQRLRSAAARGPELEAAHRHLSYALLQAGERQEAEGVLRRLLELSPDDGEAHHNLGSVLMERGQSAEAASHYQESIRLRPGYAPSHEMLQEAIRRVNVGASGRPPRPER